MVLSVYIRFYSDFTVVWSWVCARLFCRYDCGTVTTLTWSLLEHLCSTFFSLFSWFDYPRRQFFTGFNIRLISICHEVFFFWALKIEGNICYGGRWSMSWLLLMCWNLFLFTGIRYASLETSIVCWSIRVCSSDKVHVVLEVDLDVTIPMFHLFDFCG